MENHLLLVVLKYVYFEENFVNFAENNQWPVLSRINVNSVPLKNNVISDVLFKLDLHEGLTSVIKLFPYNASLFSVAYDLKTTSGYIFKWQLVDSVWMGLLMEEVA